MSTTLIKKNVAAKIKTANISPYKAKKLQRAIRAIDKQSVEVLCKRGRAVPLKVGDQKNFYAYRADINSRIIFSDVKGKKIVHDIIDTKTI